MAKKTGERGPSSSAGLVTYYDADTKTAIHIKPTYVLITAGILGILIYILNLVF
ncbi:MAG TPA: preprotein translocase subunit Sec61beta [Methanocorpusculum sp.]|nr:preprotein translocase subunit Sec61beta [Methanocorpusculum sp.]